MQPQPLRSKKPQTRYSNIVDARSVQRMLKGFVRLSVQDPALSPLPRGPASPSPPLDLRAKFLAEYTAESKSQLSFRSRKSKKPKRSGDFDVRFLFYDRLLPLFVHCRLSNKAFFRAISLIERALSSAQNPQLEKYRQLKAEGGPPNLEAAFFNYWLREIAFPALVMAVENEMPDARTVVEALFAYVQAHPQEYPLAITAAELQDKKVTIFIWNDYQIDEPTHYDALGYILRQREDLVADMSLLRDVAERVLLVSLCFEHSMFELSTETICHAVVHFCLCSLDDAFKKYLSDAARLSQPEKNRVKTLYQGLKRLRKVSKTVESVLLEIQKNFEAIQESDQGLNFREWKFACPVGRGEESDSGSEMEMEGGGSEEGGSGIFN